MLSIRSFNRVLYKRNRYSLASKVKSLSFFSFSSSLAMSLFAKLATISLSNSLSLNEGAGLACLCPSPVFSDPAPDSGLEATDGGWGEGVPLSGRTFSAAPLEGTGVVIPGRAGADGLNGACLVLADGRDGTDLLPGIDLSRGGGGVTGLRGRSSSGETRLV